MNSEWQEAYEERAAIREFDGGMSRQEAEAAALKDIEKLKQEAA